MCTTSLSVRPARYSDLEDMTILLQGLFAIEADFTPDPARQRRGLERLLDGCGKHRAILVADIDARVVGMATIQSLISTAEGGPVGLVEDVVVHEAYRGRGIGRQLMAGLAAWAAKHGLARLQLLADRKNRAALDFYRRIGWQPTDLVCLRQKDGGAKGTG